MTKSQGDEIAERLLQLLDVGLAAVRDDDEDAALLALQEAMKTAERLPKKGETPDVICLPGPK